MDEQDRVQEEMRKEISELKKQIAKIVAFIAEKANHEEGPSSNDRNQTQDELQHENPEIPPEFSLGFTQHNTNVPPPSDSNPVGGNPPQFGPQPIRLNQLPSFPLSQPPSFPPSQPQFMPYPYIASTLQVPYVQPYTIPPSFPQTPFMRAPPRVPQPVNRNPSQNNNRKRGRNNRERNPVQYDPIPISYTELFPKLLQNGKVVLTPMKPIEPPYPRWYDPNARCDYHAGAVGHSIENCQAFKSKVQSLLDAKWLSFEGMTKTPNVTHNPLLEHNNPRVNAIENEHPATESISLVCSCSPDFKLNNWDVSEFPIVLDFHSKFQSDLLENDNVMTPTCNFEHLIDCGEIEEGEEEEIDPSAELLRLVEEEEKEIQPHNEPVEVINLGTKEDKKRD